MIKDYGFSQIHNLGMLGKRGDTDYNLSVGYTGQEGMMKTANHDDFKRFTSTLSLSSKVADFMTVRGRAMYTDATKRYLDRKSTRLNSSHYCVYRMLSSA